MEHVEERNGAIDRNVFAGTTVRLAPLHKEDAAVVARWTEDGGYLRLQDTNMARPETEEEIADDIEHDRDSSTTFSFGIRRKSDDALIGTVGLFDVEWANRTAWVGIGLGERSDWGHGYGREAMQILVDYAFEELNLHRLQLTVIDYNPRAIAMYEHLGFVHEGTYREFGERDSKRYDLLLYGLLRTDRRESTAKARRRA
ncbi:MAG: GNAT family protein [Candidatus Bipolaricaulota bacterium]